MKVERSLVWFCLSNFSCFFNVLFRCYLLYCSLRLFSSVALARRHGRRWSDSFRRPLIGAPDRPLTAVFMESLAVLCVVSSRFDFQSSFFLRRFHDRPHSPSKPVGARFLWRATVLYWVFTEFIRLYPVLVDGYLEYRLAIRVGSNFANAETPRPGHRRRRQGNQSWTRNKKKQNTVAVYSTGGTFRARWRRRRVKVRGRSVFLFFFSFFFFGDFFFFFFFDLDGGACDLRRRWNCHGPARQRRPPVRVGRSADHVVRRAPALVRRFCFGFHSFSCSCVCVYVCVFRFGFVVVVALLRDDAKSKNPIDRGSGAGLFIELLFLLRFSPHWTLLQKPPIGFRASCEDETRKKIVRERAVFFYFKSERKKITKFCAVCLLRYWIPTQTYKLKLRFQVSFVFI